MGHVTNFFRKKSKALTEQATCTKTNLRVLDTSAPGHFGICVRHFGIRTIRHFDFTYKIMEIQYSYSPTVKRLICFHNGYFWFEPQVLVDRTQHPPFYTLPPFFHILFSFPRLRNMYNSNNMPFSDCISRLICI